jgi:hypothetical protein
MVTDDNGYELAVCQNLRHARGPGTGEKRFAAPRDGQINILCPTRVK